MKRILGLGFVLLLAAAAAPSMAASGDAVGVDPVTHQVVLENEHVRVLEVMAAPGASAAMHAHPPMVAISLGTARLRMQAPDGASSILDLHPGQVLWLDPLEHAWELVAGDMHVIAVELKAPAPGAAQAMHPRDPVTVDPVNHHVLFDNDRVRVFDVLATPGRSSPMHRHPPFVLVSLDAARLRMTLPDGSRPVFDLQPGQVLWLEDAEHAWELLAGRAHVVAVEVKSARAQAP
jgi:quercetin dioxygenase-like cupin family protein